MAPDAVRRYRVDPIARTTLGRPRGIAFTYDGVLYNPDNGPVNFALMTHEERHARQQLGMGAEAWWDKYLSDPNFRIEQEIEAYRAQYQAARERDGDRNRREICLAACH